MYSPCSSSIVRVLIVIQIPALVTTPPVVASEKSPGHSLSASTAAASSKKSPEAAASDIPITSALEKISSNSNGMGIGPGPKYPISQKSLRESVYPFS